MNRMVGSILALTWIVAMAALIQRDVLPLWSAQDAPKSLLPVGEYQVGIFDQAGQRIGTTWVSTTPSPLTMIRSTTELQVSRIVGMLPVGGTWILSTDLAYDAHNNLDSFKFALTAPGMIGDVTAERLERDFSVVAKLGNMRKTMLLDGELSRYLSETLRPFTYLDGLHVGQSWRIRLLDPFALIKNQSLEFHTELANVARMETIEHDGRMVECFRVETSSAVAWADSGGHVLKQEVQIPLMGRWILLDEPVDKGARRAVTPFPKSSHARTR